jgi:hypothetical protein
MAKEKLFSKVVALGGFLLAAYGVYGIRQRFSPGPQNRGGIHQVLDADEERVSQGNDGSAEFYQSLQRLAKNRGAKVQEDVLALVKSSKESEQIQGLKALGYYEDQPEFLKDLESALGTDLSMVKVEAALEGLSHRPTEAREKIVSNWLAKQGEPKSSPPPLNIYWKGIESLYKITSREETKAELRKKLVQFLQHVELARTPTPGSALLRAPFRLMLQWMPESPESRNLAFHWLELHPDFGIKQMAIAYLAQIEDTQVKPKLSEWLNSKNDNMKRLVLLNLPTLCPDNRLSLINEFIIKSENKNYLEDVLRTLELLGESGAFVVLDQVRMLAFWSQSEIKRIDEVVALMKTKFRRETESCRLRDR